MDMTKINGDPRGVHMEIMPKCLIPVLVVGVIAVVLATRLGGAGPENPATKPLSHRERSTLVKCTTSYLMGILRL